MPNSAGKKVEVQVAPGPAAETIRAYSTGADADLIVVGRSTRFMNAGSTAVRVLRSIDRALLLIPPVSSARSIEGESSAYQRAA
jgi:nucleotide-binding universal stress UspA family protein